jgi:hypothetical protein
VALTFLQPEDDPIVALIVAEVLLSPLNERATITLYGQRRSGTVDRAAVKYVYFIESEYAELLGVIAKENAMTALQELIIAKGKVEGAQVTEHVDVPPGEAASTDVGVVGAS